MATPSPSLTNNGFFFAEYFAWIILHHAALDEMLIQTFRKCTKTHRPFNRFLSSCPHATRVSRSTGSLELPCSWRSVTLARYFLSQKRTYHNQGRACERGRRGSPSQILCPILSLTLIFRSFLPWYCIYISHSLLNALLSWSNLFCELFFPRTNAES